MTHIFRRLFVACPMLLVASAAWGAVCPTAALSTYDASGFSCTVNGLTFSNFSYTTVNGLPTAANVELIPTFDAAGDTGFFIDGGFTASAGQTSSATITYTITDTVAGITGATASLISYGATGSGAVATVSENVCSPTCKTFSVTDDVNHPPVVQSNSVTFAATTSVTITKTITESGGTGSATISSFENTVQTNGGAGPGGGTVPEPASFLTMAGGLIAALPFLRRKKKTS